MLIIFLPTIYLPALLYRWNIKSSWWLWGAVALALKPITWIGDIKRQEKTAFWTTWAFIGLFCSVWVGCAAYLTFPLLPVELSSEYPKWLTAIIQFATPLPLNSLRFGAALLCLCCFAGLILSAIKIRSPHAKALESLKEYREIPADAKPTVEELADNVRRWLKVTTAAVILTVWVFALWFTTLGPLKVHFNLPVWDWLKPWL